MASHVRVFLIRHGESEHNVEDVFSGVSDIDLSSRGHSQCQALARFFRRIPVEEVYSSPLRRAVKSAQIIFPQYSHHIAPYLIEFNYGIYEGKPRFSNRYDAILEQWHQSPGNIQFPGGGNIKVHAQKAFEGLKKLSLTTSASVLACVSHRTTIRLIVAKTLGLSLDYFRNIPCSNCSITELTFQPHQGFLLKSLNVTLTYTQ